MSTDRIARLILHILFLENSMTLILPWPGDGVAGGGGGGGGGEGGARGDCNVQNIHQTKDESIRW